MRDESLLKNLFETHKPAWVLHAAAHKHVALMEDNPQEAVKNNTLGTYILAKTAAAYNTERFLFISTDKAVRPTVTAGLEFPSFRRSDYPTLRRLAIPIPSFC